jgi:hypothetical protein
MSRMSEKQRHILKTFDKILYLIGILILVGLNIIAVCYLIVNIADIKTETLNMNPPEQVTSKYTAIYYPPLLLDAPMLEFDENFTMHGVSFSIDVYLRYSGTLAEGTPVDIAAKGCLYPDGQQDISYVTVGFEGSNHYNAQDNAVPRFRPQLTVEDTMTVFVDAPMLGTITWNTQGTYYPSIVIHFNNGSTPIIENYRDDTHKVFVESYNVIRNQNNDRIILAVEIVGVFFAIEGGLGFIVRFLRKNRS